MKTVDSKTEYLSLVKEAKKHDRLYFVEAKPIISDYEYDQLIKRIEFIEKEHPDWIVKDSPTQGVKSDAKSGFQQVEHTHPMLSLANTYSEEELKDFLKRVEKLLKKGDAEYNVELKMDGVASSIRYEKGKLVRGVTRGDGKKGDDVTANVKTIQNLPHELKGKHIPDVLELRGEIFMPLKVFQELNHAKEDAGQEVYANPRNAAAGSLKLLDSREASHRKLSIMIYDMVEGPESIQKQSEISHYLKGLGLPVFDKDVNRLCDSIESIWKFILDIESKRDKFPFEIDGVVVKLNDLKDRQKIGYTGKSPRWAVAYKYAPQQAVTIIEDITVQVGRTGVLTPVAELKPVRLAGSMISRATLHNQDEIDRKDIRIGDVVVIEKGGDVIPKVVSVDLKKREGDVVRWRMPKTCPSCHERVVHIEGEVAVRCVNPNCKSRNLRAIIFFAAKGAMDIDNLGERVVEKLVESGFVERLSDIYRLDREMLSQIEGFKDKSITNLLEAIERSKDTTLARFIFALGIKYVGQTTAELLADFAGDIDDLMDATFDELMEIEGIGPKAAASVVEYFENQNNIDEIDQLLELGVNPKPPKKKNLSHPFSGKTFVLTGTLESFSRSEASALIKERGGKVSGSVSSQTDFVLFGENSGSKLEKAEKLGVAIISEDQFKKKL